MSTLPFMFVAMGAIALFTLGSWYFSADQRAKRAMRGVPARSISDVIEGELARVVGRVEVDGPVLAPLSGRPCAYWRVVVERNEGGGRNSTWRKLVDESDGVDFALLDETGKAWVRTLHVSAVLDGDARGGSGFLQDPTPELRAFLHERGHDTQGLFFNRTIRFREGVAEPGEVVAVVGVGRWERDPDEEARAGAGYRDAVTPKRLVVDAPEAGPLLLSDQSDVTRRR